MDDVLYTVRFINICQLVRTQTARKILHMHLKTTLQPVGRLGMSGAIPQLRLYSFTARIGILYF